MCPLSSLVNKNADINCHMLEIAGLKGFFITHGIGVYFLPNDSTVRHCGELSP